MTSASTATTFGTLAGSSYGMTISPKQDEPKPKTPAGLIATQAVQTIDGWVGQVIIDKQIIWQGAPVDDGEDAVKAANGRVVAAARILFELLEAEEAAGSADS